MDELSDTARAALRRYHDAAGLAAAARTRVWRDIEESLACRPIDLERRRSDRRRHVVAGALVTALAAAVLFAVCDLRGRLAGPPRSDADAAVYESPPATPRAAEPRAPETVTTSVDIAPASVDSPATPVRAQPRRREATNVGTTEGADLAAEVALMRKARGALDDGDPAAALGALADHAERFAAGQMREDRLRLRVEALCALGRGEQARAEADAFLRDHPGSTHTARVRSLCREP